MIFFCWMEGGFIAACVFCTRVGMFLFSLFFSFVVCVALCRVLVSFWVQLLVSRVVCVFSLCLCAVLPCAHVCCFHVSLLCVVGTFIFRLSCSVAVTFCLPRKAIPWLCWFHCPPFIALFCCFTMNLEIAFDSDCVHQHCCRLLECS